MLFFVVYLVFLVLLVHRIDSRLKASQSRRESASLLQVERSL